MTWHPDIPTEYRNDIVTGDVLAYLRRFPAGSVPMFLFSPPYNLNRRADGRLTAECYPAGGVTRMQLGHYKDTASYRQRSGAGKWKDGTAYDLHDDAMPWAEYRDWQSEILVECWRALAADGAIYYQHKPRVQDGLVITPLAYVPGLPIRQIVIWARAGGVNMATTHYMPTHEWIVIIAKPDFRLRDKGASGAGDVWYIPQESGTWHPAPFPLKLATTALETVRPAFVVDPFMGSGTVAVAAKLLGIEYSGNDLSPEYVTKARQRVAETQVPLFVPPAVQPNLFGATP
jgi:site-specific DNA-methyltransferase (adenine-specific)